ncbi:hypothetical protein Hanom_Chr07g00607971 [Helianthus anomalus]
MPAVAYARGGEESLGFDYVFKTPKYCTHFYKYAHKRGFWAWNGLGSRICLDREPS